MSYYLCGYLTSVTPIIYILKHNFYMQYYKKKYTRGYQNKWTKYLNKNLNTEIYSPTEGLWRWWSHLHTLGRSSPHLTTTEWRWLPIFWCRVGNRCGYPVFWCGRGQTPRPLEHSTRWSFRQTYCLDQRPGWWPPGSGKPFSDSTTG